MRGDVLETPHEAVGEPPENPVRTIVGPPEVDRRVGFLAEGGRVAHPSGFVPEQRQRDPENLGHLDVRNRNGLRIEAVDETSDHQVHGATAAAALQVVEPANLQVMGEGHAGLLPRFPYGGIRQAVIP